MCEFCPNSGACIVCESNTPAVAVVDEMIGGDCCPRCGDLLQPLEPDSAVDAAFLNDLFGEPESNHCRRCCLLFDLEKLRQGRA